MEDRKRRDTGSGSRSMEDPKRRRLGGECVGDQTRRKTSLEYMEAYLKAVERKEQIELLLEQSQLALQEELQQRQDLLWRGEREWHPDLARQLQQNAQERRGDQEWREEQLRKNRVEEERWREEQLRVEKRKWREDQQRIEQEWQAGRSRRGEQTSREGQKRTNIENLEDRKRKQPSDGDLETPKRRKTYTTEVPLENQSMARYQEWREELNRRAEQNRKDAQERRTAILQSDAEYAYQLQLTEALDASRELAGLATGSTSSRTGEKKKANVPNAQKNHRKLGKDDREEDCLICYERVLTADMFVLKGCSHKFCSTCLSQYVTVRVRANQVPIKCPRECSQQLTLDQARPFLDSATVESFQKRLMEAIIPVSQRVYCPFRKCSALMSKGDRTLSVTGSSSKDLYQSLGKCRCLECHRSFCMECRVPWHKGMTCAEYQKLPPDQRDPEDAQFHRLAGQRNWQRCKKCLSVISLNRGCNHITCRCGHQFCYLCGAEYRNKSATCKCVLWDERNIRF